MVDWDSYYKRYASIGGVTLGDSQRAYGAALNLLDTREPKITLIGGFAHHYSIGNIEDFCKDRLPETRIIALDLNEIPTRAAKRNGIKTPIVQGDLTKLPFRKNSIDLMILDFTLNCMPEEHIPEFFHSASEVLTPDGVILASILDKAAASRISRLWLHLQGGNNPPHNHPTVEKIRGYAEQFNSPFMINADHPDIFGPPIKILPFTKK